MKKKHNVAFAEDRVIWEMRIEGMSCEGCAAHIENELLKIDGVYDARIDYKSATDTVTKNAKVTEKKY